MHKLGTAFLVLSLILLIPAIYLTTGLLKIRNRWLGEVEQRRAKVAQQAQQLTDVRNRVRLLEEERQRIAHVWGDAWVAQQGAPQLGAQGVVDLGVGTGSGLPGPSASGQPSIFLFAGPEEGPSRYLGEFRVTDARVDRAAAQLARPPYPGEVETWPRGPYRIWESLPKNWLNSFADLRAQRLIAEASLRTQQLELEIMNQQIAASRAALDQRLAELNGNPNAPEGAVPEIVDGLVESLRKGETNRNQLLAEVDSLRHDLDRKYVQLQETLANNQRLVELLERNHGVSAAGQAVPATAAALTP